MKRLISIALVFVLLFAIGCTAASKNEIENAEDVPQENPHIVTPKGYENMQVEEYVYATLKNFSDVTKEYSLDIISPLDKTEAPRPVIIFLHGGGLCAPSNKREWYVAALARYFTDAGYVVVAPNYPVYDDHAQHSELGGYKYGVKKSGEAITLAYEFLNKNTETFNIDMQRVALMGVSAGSMLGFYVIDNNPDQYRMFVNFWGETVHTVRNWENFPPILSVHGTEDEVVSYKSEQTLEKRLKKYGVENKLVSLEGAPHTPMAYQHIFMPVVMGWLDKYMK